MPRALAVIVAVELAAGGLAAAGRIGDRPYRGETLTASSEPDRPPTASAAEVRGDRSQRPEVSSSDDAPATATQPDAPSPTADGGVRLQAFSACEPLVDHLKEEALDRVTPYGLPSAGVGMAMGSSAASGGAVSGRDNGTENAVVVADGASSGSSPRSFSGTNNQEEGVDEPDIVKNDEKMAVTYFHGALRAIDLSGPSPHVADTMRFPEGWYDHTDLLLLGDRVIKVTGRARWRNPQTTVTVLDVSDPAELRIRESLTVDGDYVSARAVDGTVRLVLRHHAPKLKFDHPRGNSPEAKAEATALNRVRIEHSQLTDWLPTLRDHRERTETVITPCPTVQMPGAFSGFSMTGVLTLDPQTGDVSEPASVMADASVVYATTDSLYVGTSAWPADLERPRPPSATVVHRFDISRPHTATYEATGVVPGHVPGQGGSLGSWSFSEYDGRLRVVSTTGAAWSRRGSESGITVLEEQGNVLAPVGEVRGMGKDEDVRAVRFLGDMAYLVTFRTVDPLYVVDLSDPEVPKVAGELKIPGFSGYLHPVGPGRLVGVGQVNGGAQVSLFDVSDPAHPRRIDALSLGHDTWSPAELDYHAVTWWDDPARLVVPVTAWWNQVERTGAAVVTVEGDTLERVGRITHRAPGYDDCYFEVPRSRVMGEELFTFSGAGFARHRLSDLEPLAWTTYDNVDWREWCGPREPDPDPEPTTTTSSTIASLPS